MANIYLDPFTRIVDACLCAAGWPAGFPDESLFTSTANCQFYNFGQATGFSRPIDCSGTLASHTVISDMTCSVTPDLSINSQSETTLNVIFKPPTFSATEQTVQTNTGVHAETGTFPNRNLVNTGTNMPKILTTSVRIMTYDYDVDRRSCDGKYQGQGNGQYDIISFTDANANTVVSRLSLPSSGTLTENGTEYFWVFDASLTN